ncbi:MAG: hypothetical protein AABX30_01350 [Nanoarchaeota archaeon]
MKTGKMVKIGEDEFEDERIVFDVLRIPVNALETSLNKIRSIDEKKNFFEYVEAAFEYIKKRDIVRKFNLLSKETVRQYNKQYSEIVFGV